MVVSTNERVLCVGVLTITVVLFGVSGRPLIPIGLA